MSFLITILCIGFVIFIHELGHLIAAKRAKVGVSEFAVGMGPKIWSFDFSETTYSLRAFPIGGYIKAKGLDTTDECPIEEDFREKSILARMSIIVAGSVMNVLLGFIIYLFIGLVVGKPTMISEIDQVLADYPAEKVGLQAGDQIIQINGNEVNDVAVDFINTVKESNGHELSITYLRNQAERTVTIAATLAETSSYMIGVSFKVSNTSLSLGGAVTYGLNRTIGTISGSLLGLKMLITGDVGFNELAGPVGIVQIAASQFDSNFMSFIGLIAFISISLGIINMFPLPALDGGHFLLLIIESIRKKPLNKKVELMLNNTAMILLLSLMAVIVFNDVINWGDRVDIIKGLSK